MIFPDINNLKTKENGNLEIDRACVYTQEHLMLHLLPEDEETKHSMIWNYA